MLGVFLGVIAIGWFVDQRVSLSREVHSSRQSKQVDIPDDLQTSVKNNTVQVTVLDAQVQWTKDRFRVGNLEDRPWNNCTFEVNRGSRDEVYVYRIAQVPAKKVASIPHASFMNGSGVSFAYPAVIPTHFLIRCSDASGKVGLYNGAATVNSKR